MGTRKIPVIDLFAGPGGLGEGFSSFNDYTENAKFKIALSIEMDPYAHETLTLRAFFRQFPTEGIPPQYYNLYKGKFLPKDLFAMYEKFAQTAHAEAWQAILGQTPYRDVRNRIKQALKGERDFVLIGGPPCQAYSLAGRSRNKGKSDYVPEKDHRQYLYLEYLQIIADHAPAVFVMENVKGLLSATVANQRMFERIREDLEDPATALRREGRAVATEEKYQLFSLTSPNTNPEDFIIRCEEYGVPQARHRVIILGIRRNFASGLPGRLVPARRRTVQDVLFHMPWLRSGLSRQEDTMENWCRLLDEAAGTGWAKSLKYAHRKVYDRLHETIGRLRHKKDHRGGLYCQCLVRLKDESMNKWYVDPEIGGLWNHQSR